MRFLLGLFVCVQLNNIHNEVYVGQDFGTHTAIMDMLMNDREGRLFFMDGTNRPAIYWLAGLCKKFTHDRYTIQLTSLLFVALGVPALLLFHRALVRGLRSPELRLAVMTLITLLPAHIIAGVVYAGDMGVVFPYTLGCLALARSLDEPRPRAAFGYAALVGLILAAANFVKVTFLLLPAAVLVIVLLSWRWGRIRARQAGITLLLTVVFPLLVGGALQRRNTRELATTEQRHTFKWEGTGELTWRSLLTVKSDDLHMLDAPTYWEKTATDEMNLVQPNRYSYPALFHLGVFTDVLNYADMGGYHCTTQPRPEPQQHYAVLSVRSGLFWTVITLVGVATLVIVLGVSLFKPAAAPPTSVVVWALQGAVWYLPITLVLPYIMSAYSWGYWLPRLVVPALFSAGVIGGWFLDCLLAGRARGWHRAVLGLALVQTWWHLRSLWF